MDRERSPAEDDEFDVLATLVEAYEDWHFATPGNISDEIENLSSSGLFCVYRKGVRVILLLVSVT